MNKLHKTKMTREEALNLRFFDHHCMCGGYAHTINGRPESQPHMQWCPQYDQYAAWWNALHKDFERTNK
jgi:hypothetical protein